MNFKLLGAFGAVVVLLLVLPLGLAALKSGDAAVSGDGASEAAAAPAPKGPPPLSETPTSWEPSMLVGTAWQLNMTESIPEAFGGGSVTVDLTYRFTTRSRIAISTDIQFGGNVPQNIQDMARSKAGEVSSASWSMDEQTVTFEPNLPPEAKAQLKGKKNTVEMTIQGNTMSGMFQVPMKGQQRVTFTRIE